MRKARRKTRKRRVIDQRSVRIKLGIKLRIFLQIGHVINLLVERREIDQGKGHLIVSTANHTAGNGHEVRARKKTGQEAEVQKEGLVVGVPESGVEVPEEVVHVVEAPEETGTDHAAGVLKGKGLEAKVQEKRIGHRVLIKKATENSLHQKKSIHFLYKLFIVCPYYC